jgi:hypothetical protein
VGERILDMDIMETGDMKVTEREVVNNVTDEFAGCMEDSKEEVKVVVVYVPKEDALPKIIDYSKEVFKIDAVVEEDMDVVEIVSMGIVPKLSTPSRTPPPDILEPARLPEVELTASRPHLTKTCQPASRRRAPRGPRHLMASRTRAQLQLDARPSGPTTLPAAGSLGRRVGFTRWAREVSVGGTEQEVAVREGSSRERLHKRARLASLRLTEGAETPGLVLDIIAQRVKSEQTN